MKPGGVESDVLAKQAKPNPGLQHLREWSMNGRDAFNAGEVGRKGAGGLVMLRSFKRDAQEWGVVNIKKVTKGQGGTSQDSSSTREDPGE